MTAPGATSGVGGFASTIGRYFSVVSFIPSVLLVAWVTLLVSSKAWTGPLDLRLGTTAFTDPSFAGAAFMVVISLAIGAAMHPLQFAFVQFFEGYWGTSALGMAMRVIRTQRYLAELDYLKSMLDKAFYEVDELRTTDPAKMSTEPPFDHLAAKGEASRRRTYYPDSNRELMPTRLGNVLRSYETRVGVQYGLPILDVAGHLAQVAPREQMEYVNDQRTTLDLAVRMCIVGVVSSVVAVVFLWQYGVWLLAALLPYLLAYGSYRGAVVAAHHYGRALAVLVDLNRFALYERFRLVLPENTDDERRRAETLIQLVTHNSTVSADYAKPKEPSADAAGDPPKGGVTP